MGSNSVRRFSLVLGGLVLCACAGLATRAHAEAPPIINETWTTSHPANWVFSGAAAVGNVNGTNAMILTPNSNSQRGSALYNAAFGSSSGLSIQFDYYAGPATAGADGISFFLCDGNQGTPSLGGQGGCLAYMDNVYGSSDPKSNGLSKGYIGIGFDEYGNWSSSQYNGSGPGAQSNEVAIRGAGNGNSGYSYLTGTSVRNNGGIGGGWRRVNIVITPSKYVTVKMSWNAGATWWTFALSPHFFGV